ncbi:MAG: hypothetical protein ACE5JX_10435 [Acidobacteriota bacterium]
MKLLVYPLITLLFAFKPALAQGCAMCRASVAAQTATLVHSLNLGILILLVPPLVIMGAILYAAFRDQEGA